MAVTTILPILASLMLMACISILTWAVVRLYDRRQSQSATKQAPPSNPCFHTWIPIGAQPLRGDSLAYEQTVVLFRCRGGACHFVCAFPGKWELADFLKLESDLSQLERMLR